MENTTLGIKRNINFYKNVAKETGVNVIAGTGLCTVYTEIQSYWFTSTTYMYYFLCMTYFNFHVHDIMNCVHKIISYEHEITFSAHKNLCCAHNIPLLCYAMFL